MAKVNTTHCYDCGTKLKGKVTEPNLCLECYLKTKDNPSLSIGGEEVDDSTY
jgi:NMD protein affecting ribosome stability and mRNA decay